MSSAKKKNRQARSSRAMDASTRVGLICCVALAVQYGSAPMLRDAFVDKAVPASALVLATEFAKAILAVCVLRARGSRGVAELHNCRLNTIVASSTPAIVYAVQNFLLQSGASRIDGVSFNCLNQLKLVSAAFFLYFLHGKRQSSIQCFALVGVTVAGIGLSVVGAADARGSEDSAEFLLGAAYVIVASALSGLSSTACQIVLQKYDKDPVMLTFEMAIAGAPVVVCVEWLSSGVPRAIFSSWTILAWIPVLSAAIGGLLVGEITKRLGSIAKGFSVVCGLVLTGVLEASSRGESTPTTHVLALFVIVMCSYLHTAYPPGVKTKVA